MGSILERPNRTHGPGFHWKSSPYRIVKKYQKVVNTSALLDPSGPMEFPIRLREK